MTAITVVNLLMIEESVSDGDCLVGTYVFEGHGLDKGVLLEAVARDYVDEEDMLGATCREDVLRIWAEDFEETHYVDIIETEVMSLSTPETV